MHIPWLPNSTTKTGIPVLLSRLEANIISFKHVLTNSIRLPDPMDGFVDYISLADATALGMTKILGKKVYMGVDNSSIISTSSIGRKSLWLESNDAFVHSLLIGDFTHMPGGVCGTWPGL
jgi:hypothetical protein